MPFHGSGWRWGLCVLVLGARGATADVATLTNGAKVEGYLDIDLDDYGSYGLVVTPPADDNFWPMGAPREIAQTYISSSFLFITQPIQAQVALSSHGKILNKTPSATGLMGGNGLARTVTSVLANNAGMLHSELAITNATPALTIAISVDQQLVTPQPTITRLEQDYTIRNASNVAVTLVFHTFWDMNLTHTGPLSTDDNIGAGTGACYVYQHEPNNPTMGGSLADGGSTVPTRYYFAAKDGFAPNGGPAYTYGAAPVQPVWTAYGMPVEWRNNVAYVGTNVAGATPMSGDAYLAMEWHMTLAPQEQQTIKVRRHYGTNALPCGVSATCGNTTVDPPNETCESTTDTPTCNAGTCTAPMCNDGYLNMAAGEECESAGIDSADCVGATCKRSTCGDGYVNEAAGEACDSSDGCPETCGIVETDMFSIGGGCAGCSSGGSASWLILLALAGMRRRALLRGSRRSAR